MKLGTKIWLTYWWFKLKEWTVGVNYIQGTRIPSDYPEYMWVNIAPGRTFKFMSIEEQIKELKEAYKDFDPFEGKTPAFKQEREALREIRTTEPELTGLAAWMPPKDAPHIFAYSNLIRIGVPAKKARRIIERALIKCGIMKKTDS